MGIGAAVQLARWLGVGATATLLACRPEAAPDRSASPTAMPVSTAAPSSAPPEPTGTPGTDRPPSPSAQGAPVGRGVEPGAGRFAFDFEDADLPALVRLIGGITGKRFILTGQIPVVHATVHSPEPLTADEAYQAFLAILQANGLTVVRSREFWKIMQSPGR